MNPRRIGHDDGGGTAVGAVRAVRPLADNVFEVTRATRSAVWTQTAAPTTGRETTMTCLVD
jgi:hypothetical protein